MAAGPMKEVAVPDIAKRPKNSFSIDWGAILAIRERPVARPPVTTKAIEHWVTRNTLSGRVGKRPPVEVAAGSMGTKNTISVVTEQSTRLARRQPTTKKIVAAFEPMRVSSQPAKKPATAAA